MPKVRRLASRALIVSLAGATVLIGVTSPAAADVPGLVRVSESSASNANDSHFVTVDCPDGKQLVGAGYQVVGGSGQVTIDDFRPNGNTTTAPTAVTVTAYEVDPLGTSWSVTGFAVCASPISGLVRASDAGASNSNDSKENPVSCPDGKKLLGTGFEITGAPGAVIVDDVRPNGSPSIAPTTVTVRAYEAESYDSNWSITSYGICANAIPGLATVHNTGSSSSVDPHSMGFFCSPGKYALGTGFDIDNADGEALVDDLRPNGTSTTASTSLTVIAHEEDTYNPNWTLTGYIICASSLERVSNTSSGGADNSHDITTSCPSGKYLTGGGFELSGGGGEAVVDDMEPNGDSSTAPTTMTGYGYQADSFDSSWSVTAYGICATTPMFGLARYSAQSASNSNDSHSATAACPEDKRLVGTGFEVIGGLGEVVVEDVEPNGDANTAPTEVTVFAYESDAYDGEWSVTAYALCADPVPGLVRISSTSGEDSNDSHSATATCPTGKQLIGTGYEIIGAVGEAVVDDFRPNGSTSTSPTSVYVNAYEEDAYDENWFVIAYGICAFA